MLGTALAGVLAGLSAAEKREPPAVISIRFWSFDEATRIAVESTAELTYQTGRLSEPDRIYFDLPGATLRLSGRSSHYRMPVGDKLLKQIRASAASGSGTRIVLDLAAPAEFTAAQLANPDRLMIELKPQAGSRPQVPAPAQSTPGSPAAQPLPTASTQSKPSGPATPALSAASTQSTPGSPAPRPHSTVSTQSMPIGPAEPLPTASTQSKPSGPATQALSAAPAPFQPVPQEAQPKPAVGVKAGAVQRAKDSGLPRPASRDRTGNRSLTRALGLKLARVVIDPGHGGHDTGTISRSGLKEKDLVLDIALRLGRLIEEQLGAEVVYTRRDDTFVPLEHRTALANEQAADLFVSIHANSGVRSAAGPETYYLNFSSSPEALDVAARENASSEKTIHELKDVLQKIALTDKIEESREFAGRVQSSLAAAARKANSSAKNRGVRQAPFVVLIGAAMPSILAEIGFLTNPGEERLLRRTAHRQRLAEALFRGVADYAASLSHFQVAEKKEP